MRTEFRFPEGTAWLLVIILPMVTNDDREGRTLQVSADTHVAVGGYCPRGAPVNRSLFRK